MCDLDAELDLFVERFESAWSTSDDVNVAAFFPPDNHAGFNAIVVELLRVDLDHRLSRGQDVRIDSYLERFPRVLNEPDELGLLAFEEYRLRLQSGETVTPADYSSKYCIATDSWPDMAAISTVGPLDESHVSQHPAHDDTLAPGVAFGDFVLERELGRGALARVFLARQTGIANRHVVVKFTSVQTVEIERLGRLQHSHIVPVLSVHPYQAGAALCMPYLGEATVADIVAHRSADLTNARSALPGYVASTIADSKGCERFVLKLARDLADALQHAHARDVLHGDVKPANILIADDGRAMLLDFNLAGDLNSLRPEVVGGTFRYMPPEYKDAFQAGESSLRPDVRGDVYSLGVVLLELLAGTTDPHSATERLADSVSPAFAAIVTKCVCENPADRYQTSVALLQDLHCQIEHRPLRHQSEPSLKERAVKWTRRHPRLASNGTLLALFAVVLAAASIAWTTRSRRLAMLEAQSQFADFEQRAPQACALLMTSREGGESINEGISQADDLLKSIERNGQYEIAASLSENEQQRQRQHVGRLLYYLAHGHWLRSQSAMSANDRMSLVSAAKQHHHRAVTWFARELGRVPIALRSQAHRWDGTAATTLPGNEPDNVFPLDQLLYATELNEARRFEQAQRYLDRVKSGFANDVAFWNLLASAYAGADAFERAEACLTASLALNSESWVALSDRGLARLALNEFADAEADFSKVIDLRPEYWGGYLNRALSRAEQRRFDAAIDDLTSVLQHGGPTRAYFLRSRYRAVMGDRDGATADHKAGLAAEPNDEKSWVSRGLARMRTQPKEALADFKRATAINPKSVDGWRNIAHVLSERLGDPDASADALSVIIDAGIEDAGAFAGRAVLFARAGKEPQAIADAERAVKLDTGPMTRYQAACVFALLSDKDEKHKPRALALLATSVRDLPRVLIGLAERDSDLKSLRQDRIFEKLIQASRTLYELQNIAEE